MKSNLQSIVLGFVFASLFCSYALAQPARPVTTTVRERIFTDQLGRGEAGGWVLTLSPGAEIALPASFGDADATISRIEADLSSEYWFNEQLVATFGVGGEYSNYALSGFEKAAGIDEPMSDGIGLSIRPGLRVNFSREWGAFGFGLFEFYGEPGTDFDKTFTGGGAGGVRWSPSEDFTLLVGAGATSRLDDTTSYFPVLGINWRFAEQWSFDTLGPGGAVRYDWTDEWRFGLGARYESRNFRLDDDSSVPDGVLRDDRALVEFTATWKPSPAIDITAGVGAVVYSEMTIDTAGSDEVFEETGDITPFLGLRGVIRF